MRVGMFRPIGAIALAAPYQAQLETLVSKVIRLNILFQVYKESAPDFFDVRFLKHVLPFISQLRIEKGFPSFTSTYQEEILLSESNIPKESRGVPENCDRIEVDVLIKLDLQGHLNPSGIYAEGLTWLDQHARPLTFSSILSAHRRCLLDFSQSLDEEIEQFNESCETECTEHRSQLNTVNKYLRGGAPEKIFPKKTQQIFQELFLDLVEISGSLVDNFGQFQAEIARCNGSLAIGRHLAEWALQLQNVGEFFCQYTQKLTAYLASLGEEQLDKKCQMIFHQFSKIRLYAHFYSRFQQAEGGVLDYCQGLLWDYEAKATEYSEASQDVLKTMTHGELVKFENSLKLHIEELEFAKMLLQNQSENSDEQRRIEILIRKFTLLLQLVQWCVDEFEPTVGWRGSANRETLVDEKQAADKMEASLKRLWDEARELNRYCAPIFEMCFGFLRAFKKKLHDYQARIEAFDRAILNNQFKGTQEDDIASLKAITGRLVSLKSIYVEVEKAMSIYRDSGNLNKIATQLEDEMQKLTVEKSGVEVKITQTNSRYFADIFARELNQFTSLDVLSIRFLMNKSFRATCREYTGLLDERAQDLRVLAPISNEPELFEYLSTHIQELRGDYFSLSQLDPLPRGQAYPDLAGFIRERAAVLSEARNAYYKITDVNWEEESAGENLSNIQEIRSKLEKGFMLAPPALPPGFTDQQKSFFQDKYFPMQEEYFAQLRDELSAHEQELMSFLHGVASEDKENTPRLNC